MAKNKQGRTALVWAVGLASFVGCHTTRNDPPTFTPPKYTPADYSAAAASRLAPQTPPVAASAPSDQPPADLPKFAVPQVRTAAHLQGKEPPATGVEPTGFEGPMLVPATPVALQPAASAPLADEREVPLASQPARATSQPMPRRPLPLSPQIQGLTLAQIQEIALTHNPTIYQSSASAQAAEDLRHQVGRPANPRVGYAAVQLADEGTDQHTVFVEKQFVTAGKLALNQRVLGHAIEAQRWDVESQRFRVLTDVRLAFIRAQIAQRRAAVVDEFYALVTEGVELAKARLEAQEASRPEVFQAEIQLNEAEVLRQQAQVQELAAWQQMVAIAGVPDLPRTDLVGELDPGAGALDWDTIYTDLLHSSPELRAAESRVNQARANLSRQEIQSIPNLTATLEAGHDNGTGSGLINLEVGGPIPVFNNNQGNVSAAYREYCRATHAVRRVQLSLQDRLAEATRQYDEARVAVERYQQQILPKTRDSLQLAEQAFTAGQISQMDILQVRQNFLNLNLRYIDSLGQLAQAYARIDGLLLTGGLDEPSELETDDSLRGQALDQE